MSYRFEWIGAPAFLGALLLPLIVPGFALIGLAVIALALVAAVLALAGAILAAPVLLVRAVRRHLAVRDRAPERPVPVATTIAALAAPTTARRAQ
jgi:hypothetical protein